MTRAGVLTIGYFMICHVAHMLELSVHAEIDGDLPGELFESLALRAAGAEYLDVHVQSPKRVRLRRVSGTYRRNAVQ